MVDRVEVHQVEGYRLFLEGQDLSGGVAVVRFQLRSIEKDGGLGPLESLHLQFSNLEEAIGFFRRLANRMDSLRSC